MFYQTIQNILFKVLILIYFSLLGNIGIAQQGLLNDLTWSVFTGPNITMIAERWNQGIPFYASPPRPFYTVNILGGVDVRKNLTPSISVASRLFYEQIADAHWEFDGKEGEHNLDFISLGVLGIWAPTESKKVRILFGPSVYYAISKEDDIIFVMDRRMKWSLSLGTEIQLIDKIALQIVYMQGVTGYLGKAFNKTIGGYTIPHSFQFSLLYNFKN